MHFENVLVAAAFVSGASAARNNVTDIAASVQSRLAGLELGYLHPNIILNQVTAGTEGVNADDVVSTYLQTVAAQDQALDRPQPARPMPESTQLTLCQAFHSTQRSQILNGINKVANETSRFYENVATKSLTYCVKTIQTDNAALGQSFDMVKQAYGGSY
ncbi:hypothetical protein BJX68DRAFT_261800 [Aspergillus pseudodeflectus]|uniref:Uncharacterized protein n=1 Tax=Aspergillus pseudodeflectus TaxID=176178 RepID=A0ABR4L4N6_9EURO